MGRGYFVTGTDTGVGKTLVACALLHAFASMGKSVTGMKPVAAGAARSAGGLVNEDVESLRAAGNTKCDAVAMNPYCFEAAIAPHIAAEQSGVRMSLDRIVAAYRELAGRADVVIVEGAGGLRVPLNDQSDTADLMQRLDLPVVLVVGMRLGCINHALLTEEAILARGLRLAGWVANRIDPAMPVADENIATLQARLKAQCLGTLPFMAATDPREAARRLTLERLV